METDYKVLMIDDDKVIAQSTAEYFNLFDVKTAYVTSYDEAVEFLDKNMVSLLLLDINLGDKSGFELCKKVRENYDMPILFISARTSDDDVLIALNIGAAGHGRCRIGKRYKQGCFKRRHNKYQRYLKNRY